MTDRQKRATTFIALLIISAAAIYLSWLTLAVVDGSAHGDRGPGRLFMLAIADWDALRTLLKGLPAVVSIGLALLGAYRLKDWLFYAIVVVTLVGSANSIYLYMELGSVSTAKAFWPYSPVDSLQDYASFVAAAHKMLGGSIVWFISVLLSELGIKTWARS